MMQKLEPRTMGLKHTKPGRVNRVIVSQDFQKRQSNAMSTSAPSLNDTFPSSS